MAKLRWAKSVGVSGVGPPPLERVVTRSFRHLTLNTRGLREEAEARPEEQKQVGIWAEGPLAEILEDRRWDNALAVVGMES